MWIHREVAALRDGFSMEAKSIANFLSRYSFSQWDVIVATGFLSPYLACIHHPVKIVVSPTLDFRYHTLPPGADLGGGHWGLMTPPSKT